MGMELFSRRPQRCNMAIESFGHQESAEGADDFDIDLRLNVHEDNVGDTSHASFVSRDSSCSTCSHTTPTLCC